MSDKNKNWILAIAITLAFISSSAFAMTNWHTQTIVDDMDDSSVTLAVTLTDDYDGFFTGAMLMAVCSDNTLGVAVKYQGEVFFESSVKAEVRFGKGPIESVGKWYVTNDSSAIKPLMAPPIINKLMENFINEDQFVIRIHPTYGSIVTSKFNTTGSDELNSVLQACNMEL